MSQTAHKKAETLSSWDLVFPNDANPYGSMFGGRLMALMDKVGALAGANYAGTVVTTASTEAMDFKHPIRVGDQIEARARVVAVGRTSMVIKVDVFSDSPLTGERHHCTTAHFNFVALDSAGRPAPVPPLRVETAQEKREYEIAQIIKQKALLRKQRIMETEAASGEPV
ncbi:MAG: acyl-CoA thioesterase [Nitrospirae bacterium]|nr:acyl-CoA thioesterase [Nitrospirota bacterium]